MTPDLHRALADIKARLLEAKAAPRPDPAQIRALSAERIRLEGELSAASSRHLTRHAERTIRRAADTLHVVKRKGGMDSGWYWSLPKMTTKNANLSNVGEWTPSASSVDTFTDEGNADER